MTKIEENLSPVQVFVKLAGEIRADKKLTRVFLEDPRSILKQKGVTLSDKMEIVSHLDDKNTMHVVIAANPNLGIGDDNMGSFVAAKGKKTCVGTSSTTSSFGTACSTMSSASTVGTAGSFAV